MEFSKKAWFFRHPEPRPVSGPIYPVFLPFFGCRTRCVFCSQPLQTGRPAMDWPEWGTAGGNPPHSSPYGCPSAPPSGPHAVSVAFSGRGNAPERLLEEAEAALGARRARGLAAPELAFYGGTFTAQPEPSLTRCLEAAARWLDAGLITGTRCSTRPDAVDARTLARLLRAGVSRVELGVQSFAEAVLERSRRAYGRTVALEACALVRGAGLSLGIQLMPGMPGMDRDAALADAALAASLGPDFVRLYPCLVLKGTELADWWRQGRFTPWALEETADFLAEACLHFWRAGVPVARMGLAEEPGLADGVLAGPRHPALGAMARSRALFRIVSAGIAESGLSGPYSLGVPRRYQGEFFGMGNELAAAYAEMGLPRDAVRFMDAGRFVLTARGNGPPG